MTDYNKIDIAYNLLPEIKPHVWWCETPWEKDMDGNFKPCGECIPCKHSPIMQEKKKIAENESFEKDKVYMSYNSVPNEHVKHQFGIVTANPYEYSSSKY